MIAFYQKGARSGPRPLTPPAKPGTILSTTTAPGARPAPGSLQKGRKPAFLPLRVDTYLKTSQRPVKPALRPSTGILRGEPGPNIGQGAEDKMRGSA